MKEELKYLIVLDMLNDADPDAEWSLITINHELFFEGYIDVEEEKIAVPARVMIELVENTKKCTTK